MAEKLNSYGFIANIKAMRKRNDRKAMAELRRSKSITQQSAAYEHIMPYIPDNSIDPALVRMMCVVGSYAVSAKQLILSDPKTESFSNFGDTLREMNVKNQSITNHHIIRLLDCERENLASHISHLLSLIESRGIAVDYVKLLNDIHYWNEKIMMEWARHFYSNSGVK